LVVTVIDERPVYRHGLVRALQEAGYSISSQEEPNGHSSAAVVAVRSREDLVRVAAAAAGEPVVAILADPEPERYAEALAAGACAAVAEDAAVSDVLEAVEAALVQRTFLPTDVAQELARGSRRRTCPCPLTTEEMRWLRELARGVSVARLAEGACHSERDMYRVLRRLYARIGVEGRAGAIVAATRWGLVE
jgi:DNA-binding NarL/FixJ family response regulator